MQAKLHAVYLGSLDLACCIRLTSHGMIRYLEDGWYTQIGRKHLRRSVVDGTIDSASMLYRADVSADAVLQVALKIRLFTTLLQRPQVDDVLDNDAVVAAVAPLSQAQKDALQNQLQAYTDHMPALQSFVNDFFDHVDNHQELRAFYLHFTQIAHMMRLLHITKLSHQEP